MTQQRRFILLALLLLLLPLLVLWWQWISTPLLFRAVPNSAVAVVQTANVQQAYDKFRNTAYYAAWHRTDVVSRLEAAWSFADSLLLADTRSAQPLLASLHLVSASQYDYLLVLPLQQLRKPLAPLVADLQRHGFKVSERSFRSTAVYDLCLPDGVSCFSLSQCGNLVVAASNPSLVDQALNRYHSWWWSSSLARKVQVHRADANVCVFLNISNAPLLNGVLLNNAHYGLLTALQGISNWAQLDVWFNKNDVLIDGANVLNDEHTLVAEAVKQTTEAEASALAYIPDNTAFMLYINVQGGKHVLSRHRTAFSQQYGNNALSWVGNQWAGGFTEPSSEQIQRESFIVVQAADTAAAARLLHQLGNSSADQAPPNMYRKQGLYRTNARLLAQHLLGSNIGSAFDEAYFTIINNFVLIGGSPEYLQVLAEKHQQQQTLSPQILYNAQHQLSNASLYIRPDLLGEWLRGVAAPHLAAHITDRISALPTQAPMVIHLDKTTDAQILQTTTALQYGATTPNTTVSNVPAQVAKAPQLSLLWNTLLDAPPATAPQLVRAPEAKNMEKEIAAIDVYHTLYIISNTGEVQWKRKFDEPILSKIYQIDYYGDGSLYYLLNTARHIYLLDAQGQEVKDFTKRLSMPANAGMSCLRLANETDYYFFVPCGNKGVYGYDQSGRPLAGWTPRQWLGNVEQPLRYLQYRDKDAIALTNTQGELILLDRRGKVLHKTDLHSAAISPPQIDLRNGEPKILVTTADSRTHLVNINGDGWGNKLLQLTAPADFITDNVSSTSDEESIFMTNNTVQVYNFSRKLYSWQPPKGEQLSDIFGVRSVKQTHERIGVFCAKNNTAYLLGEYARPESVCKLTNAATPFVITNLVNATDDVLLIGGTNNNVLAYKLQQP